MVAFLIDVDLNLSGGALVRHCTILTSKLRAAEIIHKFFGDLISDHQAAIAIWWGYARLEIIHV